MSGRKNSLVMSGLVVSVSLIAAAVSVMLASRYYGRLQFDLLNTICGEIVEQEPETKKVIAAALKEYMDGNADGTAEDDLLSELGYRVSDFVGFVRGQNSLSQSGRQSAADARYSAAKHYEVSSKMCRWHILSDLGKHVSGVIYRTGFAGAFVAAGFLAGILLFIVTFLYRNKIETGRILALADYLEQVNTGQAAILSASGEDEFSRLEDEIYKTVTYLYQTKDAAVQAKNGFAENLANIAHQIKTPITAISLSVQMMKKEQVEKEQVEKQLLRLIHLEEALLILSRLDAGTLPLRTEGTDVYTILVLAADNLQELFAGFGTSIDIPELGEMMLAVDLDWTMEAVMNLMKNCMEHHVGGTVHCSYTQNPLYTEILIWDEGEGFAKEDIPHLFERFYRGQNAKEGGIGIGLALAKEIIERQNGTIRAGNRTGGGACFEVRFYCH